MTLERLIASKAIELVQLLEHCDDPHFVDRIVDAVASCDYMELYEIEDGKEGEMDAHT